jgi:hypothetical protein
MSIFYTLDCLTIITTSVHVTLKMNLSKVFCCSFQVKRQKNAFS